METLSAGISRLRRWRNAALTFAAYMVLVENVPHAALQPVDLLPASAERSGCNGGMQLEG